MCAYRYKPAYANMRGHPYTNTRVCTLVGKKKKKTAPASAKKSKGKGKDKTGKKGEWREAAWTVECSVFSVVDDAVLLMGGRGSKPMTHDMRDTLDEGCRLHDICGNKYECSERLRTLMQTHICIFWYACLHAGKTKAKKGSTASMVHELMKEKDPPIMGWMGEGEQEESNTHNPLTYRTVNADGE